MSKKPTENFTKADELRILAENSSDPEEKSDLLKQANSNEFAGRENQEKSITALEELTNEDYVAGLYYYKYCRDNRCD